MYYRQQCIIEAAAALLCLYHRYGAEAFVEELTYLFDSIETDYLDELLEYTYSKIPLTAREAVNTYIRNANNRR